MTDRHPLDLRPASWAGAAAFDLLAVVGWRAEVRRLGDASATANANSDDPDDVARAVRDDSRTIRARFLDGDPPAAVHPDCHACRWLGQTIDWPDRVPGLRTWAGRQTLTTIVRSRVALLRVSDRDADLFAVRAAGRGSDKTGPSGLDQGACPDPRDVGFSLAATGMLIHQRPGVELLAILGLQTLPLVSFGLRECGFIYDSLVWRFLVETRSGGYFHRWGRLSIEKELACR